MEVRVRVQRDAEGQFIEIPDQFLLSGEEVTLTKIGETLLVEPLVRSRAPLEAVLQQLGPVDDD